MAGEEPSGDGVRTHTVHELARAAYLFCFDSQCAGTVAVQETRYKYFASKLHRTKTEIGAICVLVTVHMYSVCVYMCGVCVCVVCVCVVCVCVVCVCVCDV